MKKIICYECGSEMQTATQYSWIDEKLGSFTIPCKPEEYHFCPSCKSERLALSLCLRIEQEERKRKLEKKK